MRALKEYYGRRIISTVGPVPEMNQSGRPAAACRAARGYFPWKGRGFLP
ncbi:MAG: hypothetical protein M0C28_47335 [Candidatus Moduliflexus flocculans]|nr:hypothetical protein [Candidatus Moduliflexus flocculans]